MKLLLTSAFLSNEEIKQKFLELAGKKPKDISVAFIPTAADPEENKWFVEKDREIMRKTGLKFTDLDLKNKNKERLEKELVNKDAIIVEGGNTFYLLYWIRKSGFYRVLKDFLKRGKLYVGISSGSYVTCPNIEMATWKHQDRNRVGLKDLKALNLVPFLISVHYEPKYKPILEKEVPKANYPVKILTDNQALSVINGKVKLIGTGKEVKI